MTSKHTRWGLITYWVHISTVLCTHSIHHIPFLNHRLCPSVSFLSIGLNRSTIYWRKGLTWLMIPKVSSRDQLAPRQNHHGAAVWWRRAAHLMTTRKQRERKRGRDKHAPSTLYLLWSTSSNPAPPLNSVFSYELVGGLMIGLTLSKHESFHI